MRKVVVLEETRFEGPIFLLFLFLFNPSTSPGRVKNFVFQEESNWKQKLIGNRYTQRKSPQNTILTN